MLDFTFKVPTTIHFGKTSMDKISAEIEAAGAKNLMVVTGGGSVKREGIFRRVVSEVEKANAVFVDFSGIRPNPGIESVREGIRVCRENDIDLILAVGGGSVIDASKAIAAGVYYEGDVWDYFISEKLPSKALPVATVLTLAATGSEMNQNTVITNREEVKKLALSAPVLIPGFSILDPRNTYSVPPYHTAAGIADIMAHVFEYYLTPVEGCYLQGAIEEAILSTCVTMAPRLRTDPADYEARANIMWASTLALNGTAGSGKISDFCLHMIEHEVSAITDLSHGAGLAILIPNFMLVTARKYGYGTLSSYARGIWGVDVKGDERSAAEEAVSRTRDFFDSLGLPSRLSETGISPGDIDAIVGGALGARRNTPGIGQLTEKDIREVVELSF